MNRRIALAKFWLLALLLLVAVRFSAQVPLQDGGLERKLAASKAGLCALYALPPGPCEASVSVQAASPSGALPPGWEGLPSYAAGAAEPRVGRILIVPQRCGPYPFGDPAQTLRHELSHVLLFRSLGFQAPRWFDEGLAMRAAGEWGASDAVYSLLALPAVARGKWRLEKVDQDFAGGESQVRRSYALAKAFIKDLFPANADLTAFLLEARRQRSVDVAFVRRFNAPPDTIFQAWAKNLPWWGAWLVAASSPGVLWTFVTLLFLVAVAAAIRRRRRKFEQLPD